MKEILNVALIGWGAADKHLPAVTSQPDLKMYALCDIRSERAEALKKQYHIDAKVYTDYREMLKDPEIDIVEVATPNPLHCEMTVAALEAGKHVLCEKPMATTKAECELMIAAAKKAGKKVGVTTSVSVDHATPAAFYAHQADRNMNYEIAVDLTKANFDFYAGGGFLKPDKTYDKKDAPNIFPIFEEAGYTVARGYSDYKAKSKDAGKMILIQEEGKDPSCLPYAIDRKSDDLTLAQITESAIDFLTKGKNKGFFLMVEGGKIDWACHSNDPATVFEEVIDMDNAIKVAYEFYKKHPKETLIVVTADHETGGLGLGTGKYELHLKALKNQKQSQDLLSTAITDLRKAKGHNVTWEDAKALLVEKMGFWKELPLTWEQEKMLRDEFEQSFVKNKVVFEETLYSKTEPLAATARKVMSQIAMIGWTSGSHTAEYVPVYAVGAGSKEFAGKYDNTEIPKRIAKVAGYK